MSAESGVFDPLAEEKPKPTVSATKQGKPAAKDAPQQARARSALTFRKPSELAAYVVPEGVRLVGEMHLFRGGIFVLGGAPGVGKSFALSQLAICGATGQDWFGMQLHRRFKTMILQAENGKVRLADEYKVHCADHSLDDWVRVSDDVDVFAFDDPAFCAEFAEHVRAFAPDVIVLDPWNRATRDSMEKDFRAAFDAILAALPEGDERPALVIVAHTRKPRQGEKVSGRGLLNLLSGSLVLGSIPRAAFVLQAATDEPDGNEFVFTCCKNNNGPLGKPTAWKRDGVKFVGLPNFDWSKLGGENPIGKEKVTEADLVAIFENGRLWMKLATAVQRLRERTGIGKTQAYDILNKTKSRFWNGLSFRAEDGMVTYEPEESEDSAN